MNRFRAFVLFVEGPDDSRFVQHILAPKLRFTYLHVQIKEYARDIRSKVNAYIAGIKNMRDWDYLFLADIDNSECVTRKKEQLVSRFSNLESHRILIVRHEIESWYVAGLNAAATQEIGIRRPQETMHLTKEGFNSLIPGNFTSRTDFMTEILNRYDIETARGKNESFAYAMRKHFDLL